MGNFVTYLSELDDCWSPTPNDPDSNKLLLPQTKRLDGKIVAHGRCSPRALIEMRESGELERCPFCAYAVRKLAIAKDTTFQALWLKYCLSPDMGYIFAVLKPYGVEREKDVAAILLTSLVPDKGPLAQALTEEGRRYYRQKIFEWFLQRYAWKSAWNAKRGAKLPWPTWLNLLYPRLLGGIMIGFLPLLPEPNFWRLAEKFNYTMNVSNNFLFFLVAPLLVGFYISYDCYKLTQNRGFRRTVGTLMLGVFYSFMVFACIYWPIMKQVEEYAKKGSGYWCYAPFFCMAALVVGVLLQFFWEEKTISEPL